MFLRSTRLMTGCLLSLGLAIVAATVARAGFGCCAHCGGLEGCQKVCRLVCEDKKITVIQWGCKAEEFCDPGPNKLGCQHEDFVEDQSQDPKAPCSEPKRFVWTEWIPGGHTKLYAKKKLMKRTVTKTVPSFKWVIEDLCPQCQANCQVTDIPAGVPATVSRR
ncbi:MAG: hypothetical protein IAG10_18750 [Planctomycetaceae bacterium]|nr:hypothetical protein [Planctomycetaceae bacterium]